VLGGRERYQDSFENSIVHADQKLTALLELEPTVRAFAKLP
jgi:hypothetical protein